MRWGKGVGGWGKRGRACRLRKSKVRQRTHDRSQGVANRQAHVSLVCGFVPNREDVLVVPYREHAATDLVADIEPAAEHGHEHLLPVARRNALHEAHDPFASVHLAGAGFVMGVVASVGDTKAGAHSAHPPTSA